MHRPLAAAIVVLPFVLLSSCASPSHGSTCAERSGGAIVTFDIVGETFRVWVTDGPFIDEALLQLQGGPSRVAVFNALIAGADVCEPAYGFHVDPSDVAFADAAIELCDGTPSYVDANFQSWQSSVGAYCPWSAIVTAVDDRRAP